MNHIHNQMSQKASYQLSQASLIYMQQFKDKFEEKEQVTLAMMDKGGTKGGKKDFASKALENDKVREMKYHVVGVEELEELLDTRIKDQYGLTETQAAEKLEKFGPNALSEKKGTPWYI